MAEVFVAILEDGLLEDVRPEAVVGRPRLLTSRGEDEAVEVLSLLMRDPGNVAQLL